MLAELYDDVSRVYDDVSKCIVMLAGVYDVWQCMIFSKCIVVLMLASVWNDI
jgi:hypothetical protein